MSKMRLKPATIGVVRSCATPHAVKHAIRAMNSTIMPWPTSGSPRVPSGSSATDSSAMLLNRSRSPRSRRYMRIAPRPHPGSDY